MLIMSFMNSEKEALDLPAIVTGNGEAYPKQWLAVYVRLSCNSWGINIC